MYKLLSAGLLSCVALAGAHAQTMGRAEAEKMVIGLYAIDIAVDACDLDLTKEQEKRLEFWIDWAEKQLNVADRKLDKTYDGMAKAVENDKKAFCRQMTPIAEQALKELPAAN
jgi:hypothetical protein